jgi:hypothetical protein
MTAGDNNPRMFAETIALATWRTPFNGESGEADLHIEVAFDERGRVGGGEAPVRFRLSLKRAEVHVAPDSVNIIEINRASVRRPELPEPSKVSHETVKKAQFGSGVLAKFSLRSAKLSADANAKVDLEKRTTIERNERIAGLEVTPWPNGSGYCFKIAPTLGDRLLKGQPWPAGTPLMKIRDTGASRKRGEPPEVRVEIHCLREDIVIEQIELTDSDLLSWAQLPRNKQIAVEQYIKDELAKAGLPCSDLSEPFARVVLADASPVEQK